MGLFQSMHIFCYLSCFVFSLIGPQIQRNALIGFVLEDRISCTLMCVLKGGPWTCYMTRGSLEFTILLPLLRTYWTTGVPLGLASKNKFEKFLFFFYCMSAVISEPHSKVPSLRDSSTSLFSPQISLRQFGRLSALQVTCTLHENARVNISTILASSLSLRKTDTNWFYIKIKANITNSM